jgi:hypothetical protein
VIFLAYDTVLVLAAFVAAIEPLPTAFISTVIPNLYLSFAAFSYNVSSNYAFAIFIHTLQKQLSTE